MQGPAGTAATAARATLEGNPTTASIILTVVLFLFFAAAVVFVVVEIRKAGLGLKQWLQDFPTHAATVITGLLLALSTGVPMLARLSLGMSTPDYGDWLVFVAALCGVGMAGFGVKRFSDQGYIEAKERGKMIGAVNLAAAGAPGATTQSGDITVTQEMPAAGKPAPAKAPAAIPQSIAEIPGAGD